MTSAADGVGTIGQVGAEELGVDPLAAARRLLGAAVTGRGVRITVVEVEAYGGVPDGPWPDRAAHSYRGPTGRNTVMFGPAGRLYTYRSYGIHVCANVACGPDGTAAAVLLRAGIVEDGIEVARSRRGAAADFALARGPGNLCAALGITMADNGIDLFAADSAVRLQLRDPVGDARAGPRVGVSGAADRPWRLWLPEHPEVSAYKRSPRAPAPGSSD